LASGVPEVMHLLSHAYHAMSDLSFNVDAEPPRQITNVISVAQPRITPLVSHLPLFALPCMIYVCMTYITSESFTQMGATLRVS